MYIIDLPFYRQDRCPDCERRSKEKTCPDCGRRFIPHNPVPSLPYPYPETPTTPGIWRQDWIVTC